MIQQQQAYFLELYRTGLRTSSDLTRASLENLQRLQSQQIDAIRGAMEDNERDAREMSEIRSLDQLMALQTRIAGAQLERAADFWGRFWRSASETQVAMIHQVQSQVGQISERSRESANTIIAPGSGAGHGKEHERKERKSA